MPRPIRNRFVGNLPNVNYFKPIGIPLSQIDEVIITVDELEAIRLKDLMGLDQNQAAEKMNISQPTFHRLLDSARKKLADAIVNGKAIRVEGGNYELIDPNKFFRGFGRGKGFGRGFGRR